MDHNELEGIRESLKARLEMEQFLGVELIPTKDVKLPPLAQPERPERPAFKPPVSSPAIPQRGPVRRSTAVKDADPPLTPDLEELKRRVAACTKCPLYQTRKNVVFGNGDPHARLMFVGEAPGYHEDMQGRAFIGPAGQLLTKIIAAIEMDRSEVFICNILKCRPPKNRTPRPDEIRSCWEYLESQIELIRPEVICALGAPAAKTLLDRPNDGIGRLRGRFHDMGGIPVMPTYHPAYLLRSPSEKGKCWEDMKQIRELLGKGGR